MVWNIYFQIAGLVLTLTVMLFSYSQRRLMFKAEKIFNVVLVIVALCNCFDVLAVVAMNFRDVIGDVACQIICKGLLISIVLVACHGAWFSVAELKITYGRIAKYCATIPVIGTIITCLLFGVDVCVDIEKNLIYMRGIPDIFTFVMCILYALAGMVMVVRQRKNIKRNKRITIYSWLTLWSLAGVTQRFLPGLPIVGFSVSLSCLIMYCKLENPERNMDMVNKIFNSKAFQIEVDELIKDKRPAGIINFSIINMSVITEIFGSSILNKLIKELCSFAQSFKGTVAFRLEDNVYSIVVENKEDIDSILSEIEDKFKRHWIVNDVHINVSTTISYVEDILIFKDCETLEESIHFFALEGAKSPGDVIQINATEVENRKRKLEMQQVLDWALKNDGVEVFYQPIYNIEKGYFTAMEALVRIRDENGKLIFPNDFIEYAEKNGMILKLGEEIFRNVCSFIRRSKIENYGIEFIDVNLSVVQCMQEDLARTFKNILGEYQVPPYRVNLEITETAAIATKNTLDRNMQELIDYGVSFSLDDYGSGYSNLTYIVGLPVSIIKIDREITINYRKSDKAKIATDATVNMIHSLGMEIIVEGVENEEQYLDFKNLGVNLIQGYYFSKPIPKEDVIPFLQKWL